MGAWSEVRIVDVAQLIRGVTYAKDDARSTQEDGYLPVLRATNIQESRLVLDSDLVFVPGANISANQTLRAGDIVVATSSGSKHLVGKSALLRREWSGSFGAFCAAIRSKETIEPRYLASFLQSPAYWKQIGEKSMGVNINNLRRGDIESVVLPLPDLDEQRRIVAEIEKQFSRLDEAVANLQRVKANLKRYKAAILKAAVDGRLVETEASLAHREGRSYETGEYSLTSVVAERKALRASKGKTQDATTTAGINLPRLTDGWAWASVEEVGRLQLGRQRAPKYHSGKNMRPYLRVQNVFEDRIDLSDVMEMEFSQADFERFELQSGDVFLNEGQSPEFLGRPALYRNQLPGACFTNTLIRFQAYRCVLPEFALVFFRHCMHSGRFAKESNITTNIAHLSLGRLATVEFPVPPLAEQQRIVFEFDRKMSVVREVESEVDASLRRAESLRRATLSKAFFS